MLNSDQLGEKGESRFRELCADAQLVCNPSSRDRTGWDFIVEFDFDPPNEEATLDKRKRQYSCHVQVKTTWASNDRIEMRLSSAEFLAKEPKPTFIYVLKISDDLHFIDAYLIPVLGDNLAKILKRLRKEHAQGTTAINHMKIVFRPSTEGIRIEPTGAALREAIVAQCGPNLQAYMIKKEGQLNQLGFEARRYEATMTFKVGSHEEFVHAFLGLKKIEIKDFKAFEKRFGIKLPLEESKSGEVHIQPHPADECAILIRGKELTDTVAFQGQVFFPSIPNLAKEHLKVLIKSKFFDLLIDSNGLELSMGPDIDFRSTILEIDDWILFYKMSSIFSKGDGSITVTPRTIKISDLNFKITTDVATKLESPQYYKYFIDVYEKAKQLLAMSGASKQAFLARDVGEAAKDIIRVSKILSRDQSISSLGFDTDFHDGLTLSEPVDMLYINFITIGDITIGYYAVASMTAERHPDKISWKSKSLEPRGIKVLSDFPDDYAAFVDQAKRTTNISSAFVVSPTPKILPDSDGGSDAH